MSSTLEREKMAESILLFLIIAFVLVLFFKITKIGVLLAFLLSGVLAGQYILDIFKASQLWNFLGEVGIMFLWFNMGLEINIKRLWQMKSNIFGFGATQVLMVVIMFFPILFGLTSWSIMSIIMVSLIFAMSSTSSDLQILAERNELHSNLGRQSFSILLFQDLLSIPLLAMLPVLAGKSVNLGANVIDILVMSVGLIICVIIVGKLLINPFMRMVAKLKSKEALLLAVLLNIILLASILQLIGLPPTLGAFLSGMLLSETIYRHQIKAELNPYSILFLAFFFISLGLGLNVKVLLNNWEIVLIGLFALISIKFFAIYIVARVRDIKSRDAFLIALVLAQGGEFGLLIIQTMKISGIESIPQAHSEILIAIIVLSIMMTPILITIYDCLQRKQILGKSKKKILDKSEKMSESPSVIICGFGRVGQIVAKMLSIENISYIAIDMNVDMVIRGRENGFNTCYGDSTNVDVLQDIGLSNKKTKALIIALDNVWVSKSTIRAVKSIAKKVKIFARAKNMEESKVLIAEGVKDIYPETVESSFLLGSGLLESIGVKSGKIDDLVMELRKNNYAKLDSLSDMK